MSYQISGEEFFWDPYLLPKDESRPSTMFIPVCVGMDIRERSYGGRLGGYSDPNKVSKRNDMDNHG